MSSGRDHQARAALLALFIALVALITLGVARACVQEYFHGRIRAALEAYYAPWRQLERERDEAVQRAAQAERAAIVLAYEQRARGVVADETKGEEIERLYRTSRIWDWASTIAMGAVALVMVWCSMRLRRTLPASTS